MRGKNRLLVEIAEVAVDNPEGAVKDVIYPVADERTLRDVIAEFKATGSYDHQVRTKMRSSLRSTLSAHGTGHSASVDVSFQQ